MNLKDIEKVEIYTTQTCGHCVKAKELLSANNIEYKEFGVNSEVTKEDIQSRLQAMGLNIPVRTVPQIFAQIGGEWLYIGGRSDLEKLT